MKINRAEQQQIEAEVLRECFVAAARDHSRGEILKEVEKLSKREYAAVRLDAAELCDRKVEQLDAMVGYHAPTALSSAAASLVDQRPEEVSLDDFHAYMPQHSYIFIPSRDLWPASSVNARIPPVKLIRNGEPVVDKDGKQKFISASAWLDQHRPVEQMTWAPGLPMVIKDRLISDGGWITRNGCATFNLYRPPAIELGDATKAGRWLDHVAMLYPNDTSHILRWFCIRV